MPHPSSPPDPLAAMNSSTLGAPMPVVTLPDGRKVQTGTVGALLVNIRHYDQVTARSDLVEDEKSTQLGDLEAKFRAALPLLKMAGMFDLFAPWEWIEGARSAGRKRVGELALAVEEEGEVRDAK